MKPAYSLGSHVVHVLDDDEKGIIKAHIHFMDGHLEYRVSWNDRSESDHLPEELKAATCGSLSR